MHLKGEKTQEISGNSHKSIPFSGNNVYFRRLSV